MAFAYQSPRGTPRTLTPRIESPRQNSYRRPSLEGYTEEEMIAEARLRLDHNKQRRVMKQVLSERAPGGHVGTRDLMLAAKVANMEVPAELLADTRYAASVDQVGAPTSINWKSFMTKELQPPALKGPGGFGALPPLRKNTSRSPSVSKDVAAAPEPAPMIEVKQPRVADKEVAYWFGLLVSKVKDRFSEVRRAFRILDDDCNGFLSHEEFKRILPMFNLDTMPDAIFDRILQLIDKNGDGTITFAEFTKLIDTPNVLEAFKSQGC